MKITKKHLLIYLICFTIVTLIGNTGKAQSLIEEPIRDNNAVVANDSDDTDRTLKRTRNAVVSSERPFNLNTSNVSSTMATLKWNSLKEGPYNIEVVPAGEKRTGENIITTFSNPFYLHGLDPDTTYDFYVKFDDDWNERWAGPFTFTTEGE